MLQTALHWVLPLALGVVFLLSWQITERGHPNEPPYIRSRVPYLGHIIGMIRGGAKYLEVIK